MILPLHSSILLDLLQLALKWSARSLKEQGWKKFLHHLGLIKTRS